MKSNLALSKPRYVLLFLLLMVTVAVDCFFVENHAWFNNGARNEPNIYEYYFLFALCLLMSGAFLYAAHTMGKAKVSYPFLIALGVLFFSDIIAIVFFPGIYDTGELMYLPDAVTKVRYILGFSITCVGLYCVLGIAPQILRNKSTLDVFFLLLVLLASIAVIYSVIKEFDLYKAMIVSGGPEDAYAVPSSFTSNRNVYARLLFYGLMAECYLQCKNPHWWRYLIVLVFFLFECVTLSKISVAMSCFFIGAFLIYRFFASWKTHQTRNSVWFMIVLVALVTLVVGYFSGLFADHLPKLWAILDKTKDALGNSLQASFEARLYSWTDILRMIQKSPLNLWFGYGDYNMQQAYATIEELPVVDSVSPFDGAYILILTKNGILGLMMAGLFVVYLLWLIIASLKRGSHTAWASLLMLASFLGLGIFESVSFFGFTSLCMVMLGMVVLPLLTDEYNARHPYRENLMIAAYASSPKTSKPVAHNPRDSIRLTLFWLFPIIGVILGGFYGFNEVYHFVSLPYNATSVSLAFLVWYLFLPLLVSGVGNLKAEGHKVWAFIMALVLIAWSISFFVTPWNSHYKLLAFAEMGVGFILLVFFLCLRLIPSTNMLLSDYWEYLVLLGVSLALAYVFAGYLPGFTGQLWACVTGTPIILWLAFLVCFPHGHASDPLSRQWTSFEYAISAHRFHHEVKEHVRVVAYLTEKKEKKEVPVHE